MKTFTKLVALFLLLSMVCLAGFAGCAKDSSETVEPTSASEESEEPSDSEAPGSIEPCEIRFAHFSAGDSQAQTIQSMLDLFAEAYPNIKVSNEPMGYGEYFNNLTTWIAGGSGPDVFEMNAENFSSFVTSDQAAPIGPIVDSLGMDLSGYNQGLIDNFCTANGQLYGLPFSFSTVVMVYNMDMFDEAGLEYPNNDWTMEDVLAAAQVLAKPEEDVWGFSTEMHQIWAFYKKAAWNGGRVISEDGTRFVINSPENIETFQMLQDLVWAQHVMPSVEEQAGRSSVDLFADGRLAMVDAGIWAFAEFTERCPDIRWGVCVEPGITQKGTAVFCNQLCVSTTSENQAAAVTFADFMCSNPDVVQLRLDASWELPSVADPSIMAAYVESTPPENKQAVLDSAQYAVAPPVLSDFQVLVDIMGEHLEQLRDGMVTAEEALNAAQADAEAQINLSEQ